jgi:hypothetical protein
LLSTHNGIPFETDKFFFSRKPTDILVIHWKRNRITFERKNKNTKLNWACASLAVRFRMQHLCLTLKYCVFEWGKITYTARLFSAGWKW